MLCLMDPEPLKTLPENWSKALAIVAHPDDMEFGAAAAVARWTGQGKHISYVMVTSGEAGIDGMEPEESRRVREAEQVESCRIVGRRRGGVPRVSPTGSSSTASRCAARWPR